MRRTWFFHNAVGHPVMAVLAATGRALRAVSEACIHAALRIHDETCPTRGEEPHHSERIDAGGES